MKDKFFDKELWKKCRTYGITAFLVVAACITFYFLIEKPDNILGAITTITSTLSPIITGLIIAFLLNPIMLFFESAFTKLLSNKNNSKINKPKLIKYSSIICAILSGIAIVTIIIMIIIPNLVNSISDLITGLPNKASPVIEWLNSTLPKDAVKAVYGQINAYLNNLVPTDILKSFEATAGYFASGVVGIYNFIFNVTVGIVVSFYVLSSKDYFKKILQKLMCILFKKNTVIEIVSTAKTSYRIFTNFIVGKLIGSVIIGVVCFIGMLILGIPYALLISFIIAITNIIPFFGPFIGAVPSTILILLDTPIKAVWFVIFIIVLQWFDGNVLEPRILHDSLGISSFWVVFSIMLFSGLFGMLGMLIGAPLFAVIYNIVCKYVNRKLESKGLSINKEDYTDVTKTL